MDVCGVPQKESSKKACLSIFGRYTAPAPGTLSRPTRPPQRKRSSSISQKGSSDGTEIPDMLAQIEANVKSKVLSSSAAKRLRVFLTSGCSPLPANIDEALDTILVATGKVRSLDAKESDPRRLRRYEDVSWLRFLAVIMFTTLTLTLILQISKIVKSLKHLVLLMKTMGIGPIVGSKHTAANSLASRPLYLALDLGLRQKRKHYNGQLFFQAIVLPDNFFDIDTSEQDNTRKSILGLGTKVAEGGRYDDLVSSSSFVGGRIDRTPNSVEIVSSLMVLFYRFGNIVLPEILVQLLSTFTLLHRFQW